MEKASTMESLLCSPSAIDMDELLLADDFDEALRVEDLSRESLTPEAANIASDDSEPVDLDLCDNSSSCLSDLLDTLADESSRLTNIPASSSITELPHSIFTPMSSRRNDIMKTIEEMFSHMIGDLTNEKYEIKLYLRIRRKATRNASSSAGAHEQRDKIAVRQICFPGESSDEAWRFSVVIRLLQFVHEALRNDTVLSKRDIYYRDPALFGRQSNVDRYIDDIAFTFGVPRSALNITAAAKGLIAGAFRFCRRDGAMLNPADEKEGMLVPNLRDVLSTDLTHAKWILVIEKEATFRAIAASQYWEQAMNQGIIITGKGYPDLATRALLHFLSTPSPRNGFANPKVWGLADFDPDGLAILSTYRYGSKAHDSQDLCTPRLSWLGLRSEHLMIGSDMELNNSALLTLSPRDRQKARRMLQQEICSEDGMEADAKKEVQTMLMLNVKAELQLLDTAPDGMERLLGSVLPVER